MFLLRTGFATRLAHEEGYTPSTRDVVPLIDRLKFLTEVERCKSVRAANATLMTAYTAKQYSSWKARLSGKRSLTEMGNGVDLAAITFRRVRSAPLEAAVLSYCDHPSAHVVTLPVHSICKSVIRDLPR